MQQVTKVLKPAFIPRPGNVIIDLDYCRHRDARGRVHLAL